MPLLLNNKLKLNKKKRKEKQQKRGSVIFNYNINNKEQSLFH